MADDPLDDKDKIKELLEAACTHLKDIKDGKEEEKTHSILEGVLSELQKLTKKFDEDITSQKAFVEEIKSVSDAASKSFEEFAKSGKKTTKDFEADGKDDKIKKFSSWFTSIANSVQGGFSSWQVMFEGSVKDITDFRVSMRKLAYQTEGITGNFGDLQAEFSNIGKGIASRTGVNVTQFQKSFLENSKKGFKDNKKGMNVLESGLRLSTLIGAETSATANLFSDWHRELGLSANEMNKMSSDMQDIARNTGVTGDELLGAMKASQGILTNMRNQGTLTSDAAKKVITMMAEAKKAGFEESTGKVLNAISSYSGMNDSDQGTKTLLYTIGNKMGGDASQRMLQGNFGKTNEDLTRASAEMKNIAASLIGINPEDFDFAKLTEDQRNKLTMQLHHAYNIQIAQAESLYKTFEKGGKGLRGVLDDFDKVAQNERSTAKEKLLSEKNKNRAFLKSSMDVISKIAEKSENQSLKDTMSSLETDSGFKDSRTDIAQLHRSMTPDMERKFGLSGDAEQKTKQIAAMDGNKQGQIAAVVAAAQLKKFAKDQGTSVKDFGPELIAAFQRGDEKKFRELNEEMQSVSAGLSIDEASSVDPLTELEQFTNELNETMRNFFSPLTAGILGLIGVNGLLIIQMGALIASLVASTGVQVFDLMKYLKNPKALIGGIKSVFSKGSSLLIGSVGKLAGNKFSGMGGSMGKKAQITFLKHLTTRITKSLSGFLKPLSGFLKPLSGFLKPISGLTKPLSGFLKPLSGLFKPLSGLSKLLGGAAIGVSGIFGAMEAKEHGRTTAEGGVLGALTGGAGTGSFLSSSLGVEKGSATDKGLGIAGAAAYGAVAGMAIPIPVIGPLIGAAIGAIIEIIKIITEGTDILATILSPLQVIFDYIYNVCVHIYDIFAGLFTLDFGRMIGAIGGLIFDTFMLIPVFIIAAIKSIFVGIPKLIFHALNLLWNIPKMIMDSIKSALAGLVDNEWFGPIFKVLSDTFNIIYDAFMTIWTPISEGFGMLLDMFDGLGKIFGTTGESGSLLSGIVWLLQKAIWGISFAISFLLLPLKLLAKLIGFVVSAIGGLIQLILIPFKMIYNLFAEMPKNIYEALYKAASTIGLGWLVEKMVGGGGTKVQATATAPATISISNEKTINNAKGQLNRAVEEKLNRAEYLKGSKDRDVSYGAVSSSRVHTDLSKSKLEEKTFNAMQNENNKQGSFVGEHAIPTVRVGEENQIGGVEPVHLRDVGESIRRERAGSNGGKLQSEELCRMEECSYQQIAELQEIKNGIYKLVSLMTPDGNILGSAGVGLISTKDSKRPKHAAKFGQMKYGKMGGSPNRNYTNSGDT